MTPLPKEIWERVLEFARPTETRMLRYPKHWEPQWHMFALNCYWHLCDETHQTLQLALVSKNLRLLERLRHLDRTSRVYWHYICRYQDYFDTHEDFIMGPHAFHPDDPEVLEVDFLFGALTPPQLEVTFAPEFKDLCDDWTSQNIDWVNEDK